MNDIHLSGSVVTLLRATVPGLRYTADLIRTTWNTADLEEGTLSSLEKLSVEEGRTE